MPRTADQPVVVHSVRARTGGSGFGYGRCLGLTEQSEVRARFEVPEDRGFMVADVRVAGRPIQFGAQLADRLHVRLRAAAKPGAADAAPEPCVE